MLGAIATVAGDPADIAGTLATNVGGQMLTTLVGVLPVLVPTLLGFWALSLVTKKLGIFKAKPTV